MSTQNPMIVFSGSESRAADLMAYAESNGWLVLYEPNMLQTLGQVVFLYPNLVIIEDSDADLAQTVYSHLRSINTEPILILSDHPEDWDIPVGVNALVLPRTTHITELAETVLAMVYGELMTV
jgi:hypothetical protein